jgi:peptide/nickel transport system permease protein
VVSVGIACTIAVLLGVIAGYYSGAVDMIIMRATDITMCFPTFVIIVTAVALVGPSIYNTMIVIGIFGWPALTRILRAQVLSVREWEFVTAARSVGARDRRIIFRHVVPNVIGPLVVAATLGVAGAILAEAGLSFLGLGVLPPTPTWGNMLNEAHNLRVLAEMPWVWVPPGVFIFVTVLVINFIGDGLRDALDPRTTL